MPCSSQAARSAWSIIAPLTTPMPEVARRTPATCSPTSVIKLATDAGFKLVDQSEINANPKDTKDYEKGVWTLPPTLTLGDVDRDKYLAIGESDRMTLKFVKPKGDQIFEQGTDKGARQPAKELIVATPRSARHGETLARRYPAC